MAPQDAILSQSFGRSGPLLRDFPCWDPHSVCFAMVLAGSRLVSHIFGSACLVLPNEMGLEELSHCKRLSRDSLQRGCQGMAVECQCGSIASMMAGCLSDRKGGEVQCEGLDACPACSHVDIVPPTSLLNPPECWILARKVQRRAKEALPTSFIAVQELDMLLWYSED